MKKLIRKYYPNAREGEEFTRDCIDTLKEKHDMDLSRALLATSVCSDEIIRSATNFRDYVENREPFHLAGLAGFPFSGLTGLNAFLSHLPDEGSAIILYGPHIGVMKDGTIGSVVRKGQKAPSACCGALKAAVGFVNHSSADPSDPELDYQMHKIEEYVSGAVADREKEGGSENRMDLVTATDAMYRAIDDRIQKLVSEAGGQWTIALIGGIIINTDFDTPDWFALKRFEVSH